MLRHFTFAFTFMAAACALSFAAKNAEAKPAASFVDTLGEIAAPAGYLDMCLRGSSPFCATPGTGRVEMATKVAATIAGVQGDAPTAAVAPMHHAAALVVRANASIASIFQPVDTMINGDCAVPSSYTYGPYDYRFARYPQGISAISYSAQPELGTSAIWNTKPANENAPLPGNSSCTASMSRAKLNVSVEPSLVLWSMPLPIAQPRLGPTLALPPSAAILQSDAVDPVQSLVAPNQPPVATRTLLKMLKAENLFVNAQTQQMKDELRFGQDERWERSYTGDGARGDCEDLAIEKRIRLIEAGFPADRLSFGVVYRADVGLHAVLVARLDTGDYVLDSLSPFVERWDKVPYSWVSLQNPKRHDDWRAVRSPHQGRPTQMVQYTIVVSS